MVSLRSKLIFPTLLIVFLFMLGIGYIAVLQYNTFRERAEINLQHQEQFLRSFIGGIQQKARFFAEPMSNKWHFVDSVATWNINVLLDEITPFYKSAFGNFATVYDMEGNILACAGAPGVFDKTDELSLYIKKMKTGSSSRSIVALYQKNLLILELKRIETEHGAVGVLAVGQRLDEKKAFEFAGLHQNHLVFLYNDIPVVFSEENRMSEKIPESHIRVKFEDNFGKECPLNAILYTDTSKTEVAFWWQLFMVISLLVIISSAVLLFSRRIIMNTVNTLEKARVHSENELMLRKQAEDRLKQMNEKLEERVQERTQNLQDEIVVRRQTEKDLQRNEALLNATQQLTKVGGWEWDVEKQTMYWTEEVYRIHDFQPNSFVPGATKHIEQSIECYDPVDRTIILEAFRNCADKRQAYDLEFPFTTTVGRRRWIRTVAVPILKDDRVVKILGNIMDITESKQAEEALQESEERHRLFFENSPIGIIHYDNEGVITAVNDAMIAIFGSSREKLIGLDINDIPDKMLAKEVYKSLNGESGYYEGEYISYTGGRAAIIKANWIPITRDGEIIAGVGIVEDVTENKQAEKALQESEKKYRRLTENAKDMIYRMSLPDGRYEYVSPASIDLFGYTPEAFYESPMLVQKVIHPAWMDYFEEQWENLISGSLSPFYEYQIIHKSGEERWLHQRNVLILNDNGQPKAMEGIVTDITKRKQTENALQKSEERYKGLFKNISSGVAIYEVIGDAEDFIFTDFNKAAEKIDNQKKETLIGRSIFEARPQIEEFGLIDVFREVWKTGKPKNYPIALYQDGKLDSWYQNFVYKLPTGEIVAIFTDETDRRRAEQALKIEHDKLQRVLNGMGESIYIVDKDFNIEFQNKLFINFFGDHKGKKCYKAIYKRNDPCQDCLISKALRTNSIQQKETDLYRGSKYYDLTFSPLKEEDGTDKAIIFMRDITEKKLIRAEAMRAGHLASLGELAAGVAHEINNPITGIITIAEVLSNTFHKMGKDVELPNLIITEGERIGKIVKNLLSFARDREEEHKPVQINDILNDTFDLIQKQILKDGIHLSVAVPPGIPKIKARAHEIQQVFLNIISNARYALNKKFPKPNKEKILKVSVKKIGIEKERYVRIIFYDRGTGISKDIIDKIKDPFFSTKPQGEGTGLGLSISHGIISIHKGKFRFESQEEKYTKVMIDLPAHNG